MPVQEQNSSDLLGSVASGEASAEVRDAAVAALAITEDLQLLGRALSSRSQAVREAALQRFIVLQPQEPDHHLAFYHFYRGSQQVAKAAAALDCAEAVAPGDTAVGELDRQSALRPWLLPGPWSAATTSIKPRQSRLLASGWQDPDHGPPCPRCGIASSHC